MDKRTSCSLRSARLLTLYPPCDQDKSPTIASGGEQATARCIQNQNVRFHGLWRICARVGQDSRLVPYQIFPERFRNGDPSNDPTVADIVGADPSEPPHQWQVHPWGSDWYRRQPYEVANGEPELWKHLLRRRYGGDLQGHHRQARLHPFHGFNAIYLNPVFDSPSLHKYDSASYHHIDPNFGPDPAGDRAIMAREDPRDPDTWVWTRADELALQMIDKAHQRDIRVIFDGVFNHMGINSFAFRDLKHNQQNSPYKDWFTVLSWDDSDKGTTFDYKGWGGVKSLPEFKQDANGLVSGPKDYIFAATERWMNPKGQGTKHGIDGWRLDVAFCIAHPFWKDWRKHAKAINPEAFLTAEIVDSPHMTKPYLQGDEFDGEMNYNFAFAASEFIFNSPDGQSISASDFDRKLGELRNLFPKGVAYVTQNLFGSHDANYYGDEVGMWGSNDPDCRKPMIWPDIEYDPETTNPDGSQRPADLVMVDLELQLHYRTLIAIRTANPALSLGDFSTLLANDEKSLFVFQRQLGSEIAIVILNNDDRHQRIVIDNPNKGTWKDLLGDSSIDSTNDAIHVDIPAKWGAIIIPR